MFYFDSPEQIQRAIEKDPWSINNRLVAMTILKQEIVLH